MTIPSQDVKTMKPRACSKCNEDKPESEFYLKSDGRLATECKDCTKGRTAARYIAKYDEIRAVDNAAAARRRSIVKDAVFEAYGGYVCVCCGETEKLFMTLDHINNDGAEFRRRISGRRTGAGYITYRWLVLNNFPDGFQVLCMNCNHGKRMNNGVCPHVRCNDQGINPIGSSDLKRSAPTLRLVKIKAG